MPEKRTKVVISSTNIARADEEENDKTGNCSDSFSSKYRVLAKIGEGSYSEVLKCRNRETGVLHAAKRLKHSYRGWKRVNDIAEVVTLRKLPRHPNILQMMEIHYDPGPGRVSLIFELMEMNLYELIKDRKRLLSESRVRVFMFQLIRALRHLHKNGIFHRDVKPENILLETKTDILKLGDLGSVRGLYSKPPYTEYISTRWYRSPECLLTSGFYNYKMDIWAAGCVFYEIMTLRPLFPGASEIDQISRIHQILGPPPPKMLQKLSDHSEMSKKIIHRSAKPGRRDSITKILGQLQTSDKNSKGFSTNNSRKYFVNIEKLLPNHVNRDAIDLLRNMLQYDADNRPTSHTALQHPYFDELRQTAKKLINQVTYHHPLMTILGPEFVKEVNDEDIQRKQLLNDLAEKVSSEDDDYDEVIKQKRHRRRTRKRAKEYPPRRVSSVSEGILDSESESSVTITKSKVHSKSPKKEKPLKSLQESKALNITNCPEDNAKESEKVKHANKAYEDTAKKMKIFDTSAPRKRPPLPPQENDVESKRSSNAKLAMLRNSPRESFRSLSQIAIIDEFPKCMKSEQLTKADLQKINEGRKLVQMLPIGKSDIMKSVLSSDISPQLKTSVPTSKDVQRHLKAGTNLDSEQKVTRIRNIGNSNKSQATKTEQALESKSMIGNVPSFADRLKTLYPMPKLIESMNIKVNPREPISRQQLLEKKARALGIMGYKMPVKPLSDAKYEDQSKGNNSEQGGVSKRSVPGAPQMPPLSPVDIESHRSYLRRRRESVHIEKYKSEMSPYTKFFVADDLAEEGKSLRAKKTKDVIIDNVVDLKSGDKKCPPLNSNNPNLSVMDNATVRRVTEGDAAIAAAANMPLNTDALERQRLYLQRQRNYKYKSDMTPYAKFLITKHVSEEGKTKDTPAPRREIGANAKGPGKKTLSLDSNNNYSGYNKLARKAKPTFETMDMESSRWYLPRNTNNNFNEKYKAENSSYAKYHSVDDVQKRSKVMDSTGASSIVFPRNRFGDSSHISETIYPSKNNSLTKDYKYSSKTSMDFHPNYRYPLNAMPKTKF